MNLHTIATITLIIIFTLISGIGDAQGFIHTSSTWNHGKIIWIECVKALIGFGVGAGGYIVAVNYMKQAGILIPELQTMIWFVITILGVALASGELLRWQRTDQIIAVISILCISWLVIRHG